MYARFRCRFANELIKLLSLHHIYLHKKYNRMKYGNKYVIYILFFNLPLLWVFSECHLEVSSIGNHVCQRVFSCWAKSRVSEF